MKPPAREELCYLHSTPQQRWNTLKSKSDNHQYLLSQAQEHPLPPVFCCILGWVNASRPQPSSEVLLHVKAPPVAFLTPFCRPPSTGLSGLSYGSNQPDVPVTDTAARRDH